MYNIIFESFEDGQKENTYFTRILTYKSKGVKGSNGVIFWQLSQQCLGASVFEHLKITERFGWQKMQTCPLPPAPLLCLFDISASLLVSKIFSDLCIQI